MMPDISNSVKLMLGFFFLIFICEYTEEIIFLLDDFQSPAIPTIIILKL